MDKLYVGDIPLDFKYADFNSNYIDLYNVPFLQSNRDYTYYRVYLYDNTFLYSELHESTGNYYYNKNLQEVFVTDNPMYRRDIDSILIITLLFCLVGLWLINLVTSFVKKGGVLGGLF